VSTVEVRSGALTFYRCLMDQAMRCEIQQVDRRTIGIGRKLPEIATGDEMLIPVLRHRKRLWTLPNACSSESAKDDHSMRAPTGGRRYTAPHQFLSHCRC